MMMCSTNTRSSLELMLDLIKQRDEQPVDVPPALPVRPMSRARLPTRSRRLPVILHKSYQIEGPKENEVKNKQEYSANTVPKKIDSMNLKDDTRERPLEKILEIQKSFRGYQVRCYYLQLKRGTITLQSFIRGETARRNFQFLSRRLEAVIVIQRLAKQLVDRRVMQKRRRAAITLQSAIRGWLTRRSLNHKEKVKTVGHIQVSPSALANLHRRLHILETEMGNKEEENAIIRRRLHRYDEKWLQYEKKMESMKKKWHDQLASLRRSLSAAKNGLATERTRDRLGNFIPISLNSCSNADCARTMNEFLNLRDVNETRLKNNRVDHTSLHIDSRRSSFHDDSRSPDEEFQILKLRFEAWKKDYKVQLQEVKTMLQKLGHLETKKNRKKWWVR